MLPSPLHAVTRPTSCLTASPTPVRFQLSPAGCGPEWRTLAITSAARLPAGPTRSGGCAACSSGHSGGEQSQLDGGGIADWAVASIEQSCSKYRAEFCSGGEQIQYRLASMQRANSGWGACEVRGAVVCGWAGSCCCEYLKGWGGRGQREGRAQAVARIVLQLAGHQPALLHAT